jgi:hypothetical protein
MRKHILTLNGGGSLGLMSAIILDKIEKETGIPTYHRFDIISGVSTGAILGACLAHGMPASDLVAIYKELIPTVFGNPNSFWKIWKAKYDHLLLEKLLKEHLNFPLNEMKTNFMCHAVQISEPCLKPIFFKSWRKDQPITWEAVKASCSAPTFFSPTKIGNDWFVDGSVCVNNVSTCALAESIRLGNSIDDTYILNLACCTTPGFEYPEKLQGLLNWATKISTLFVSVSDPLADYQCVQLLQNRHCSIDPKFDAPIDFTDISRLEYIANQTWDSYKEMILKNLNGMV